MLTKEEIDRVNEQTMEMMKIMFPQVPTPELEKNIQAGRDWSAELEAEERLEAHRKRMEDIKYTGYHGSMNAGYEGL